MQVGVSQNYGYLFGGAHTKDYSILGSILGSPILGKYQVILKFIKVVFTLSSTGTNNAFIP